jgi:hypothetical protein
MVNIISKLDINSMTSIEATTTPEEKKLSRDDLLKLLKIQLKRRSYIREQNNHIAASREYKSIKTIKKLRSV